MAIDIIARGMIEESYGDISHLSEQIDSHTGNGNIHVTTEDKSKWNGYDAEINQNKSDISALYEITSSGSDVDGKSSYTLTNAVDYPLMGLNLYGKSTQDGVPTPENPVEIVSVGDSGSVSVQACEKNLLDMSLVQSTTKNGVTFTVNTDGSVLANGTASADIAFDLITLTTKGDYIYSGTPKNGSTGTTGMVSVRITKTDNTVEYGADNGAGNKLVMDDSVKLAVIRIELHAGASPDNVIFYPMLLYATEEDATYEPYKGSTANITSALPLCGIPVAEGGNYTDSTGQQWVCDEVVYNADGTGKIVKRTAVYTISKDISAFFIENAGNYRRIVMQCAVDDGGNVIVPKDGMAICSAYRYDSNFKFTPVTQNIDDYAGCFALVKNGVNNSTIRFVTNATTVDQFVADNLGVKAIYPRETPQEIPLSAAEMSALRQLQTFNGITNISNDGGADMSIKYCTNKMMSEYVMPITTGLQSQIDELKSAVLSLGGNV